MGLYCNTNPNSTKDNQKFVDKEYLSKNSHERL